MKSNWKHILLRLAILIWLICFWVTILCRPPETRGETNIGQTYAEGAYTWIGQSYPEHIENSMEFYTEQAAYAREQAEIKEAEEKSVKIKKKATKAAEHTSPAEVPEPPEGMSGTYLGKFRISHYTDAPDENGGYTCTASGTDITPGRTVAMKSGYLPYGTKIYIAGVGYRVVEDCGVGSGKIDVAVASKSEAFEKGVFYAEVWVVG